MRIVIVIVVAVMHGQLAETLAGKFAGASAAHVGIHLQGLVSVAHLLVALSISKYSIQFRGAGGSFIVHRRVRVGNC